MIFTHFLQLFTPFYAFFIYFKYFLAYFVDYVNRMCYNINVKWFYNEKTIVNHYISLKTIVAQKNPNKYIKGGFTMKQGKNFKKSNNLFGKEVNYLKRNL